MLIIDFIIFLVVCFVYASGVYEEVCKHGQFKANCSEEEAIIVETAVYGQGFNSSSLCESGTTTTGRCSIDVSMYFNGKCGGMQTCKIEIPNRDLIELRGQNCKNLTELYLEIVYNCKYVYSAPGETCSNNQSLAVAAFDGHLSSIVAAETNKGSEMCPWKIRLRKGQSVRFILLDFGFQQSSKVKKQANICYIYAKFVLRLANGESSNFDPCGGDNKRMILPIDVSAATEVDISLMMVRVGQDVVSFLIEFEVLFRCSDFIIPANAAVNKSSDGLRITCFNATQSVWELKCVEDRWIPDPHRICDDSMREDNTSSSFEQDPMQTWILTVLPAEIVSPVAAILVLMAIIWKVKKQRRRVVNSNCSSTHHYSDLDVDDQSTPEILTDSPSETPGTNVSEIGLTEIGLTKIESYSGLTDSRDPPMPTVYSGLRNDSLMEENLQNSETDSLRVDPSVTPNYANEFISLE